MNQLIMFDIDGTLLRTKAEDHLYEEAMKEWLSIETINTDWTSYKYVTDSGIAAELFTRIKGYAPSQEDLNYVAGIFSQKWEQKLKNDPFSCVSIEGIHTFLTKLHNLPDTAIAIATGGWKKSALLKLMHSKILLTDIAIASSNDTYSREGIMEIAYKRALKRTGLPIFQNVVYFGDGEWDVAASSNLGYNFIGIDSSNHKEALIEKGAKYIFQDYRNHKQLIDLIYKN